MQCLLLPVGVVAWLGLVSAAQAAGDVQAGKTKAAGCVACHGANGQGVAPNPKLAGTSEDQFVQAMKVPRIRCR
jgi:cytochrome c553